MPRIKTRDGTELHVKDWGTGRPVILLHGWPLSADSWDAQALALAQAGYRAIAYDRRGFGRSDQPWQGYDYDTLTDDLADVMQATGATEDAVLIGFSMGGGEVARYMSRYEGKGVVAAGLISSVVPFLLRTDDNPDGVSDEALHQIAQGVLADRPNYLAGFIRSFFGMGVVRRPVSADMLHWAWLQAMQAGLRPTLACIESFGRTDFRADLPAFRVPTLVLHGTADTIVPIQASARQAAAQIADAQLVEYEGAPHGLFVTESDRLTRDLLTFLGG